MSVRTVWDMTCVTCSPEGRHCEEEVTGLRSAEAAAAWRAHHHAATGHRHFMRTRVEYLSLEVPAEAP